MSVHSTELTPVAYSFTRFSDPEQSKGDSLRRQTEDTKAWCERNGYHLDTTLTLHHVGSAYRGKHRDDKHALGQFLKLVERGRVARGSYLIIENLDRLSREDELKALRLWMDLLDSGINLVQLSPETVFRHDKIEMPDIMRAIIELSRGHSESRMKSERIGKAWGERKRRARETGETLTLRLPDWIEVRDKKRCVKPGVTAIIKRIFKLSARGYGSNRIERMFIQEGVPALNKSQTWTRFFICKLLGDRRLIGELQPMVYETGEPDGEVIKDYYPAVLTEAEFYAGQRGRDGRRNIRKHETPIEVESIRTMRAEGKSVVEISRALGIDRHRIYRALIKLGAHGVPRGQKQQSIYLFNQMVYGGSRRYVLATRDSSGHPIKSFLLRGKTKYETQSLPCYVFERAILHKLNEIDPREVLDGANGHDNIVAIEGELGEVDAEIDRMNADMETNGFSTNIGKQIRRLETRQAELSRQLADARQKAANPLSAAWGEVKSLLAALDSAADQEDMRLRLRLALRRIIARIEMAVFIRGKERTALVDVEFTGAHAGRFRSFTIWYQPNHANASRKVPGKWAVESVAGQGKPIEFTPREEPGEPPIPHPSEWIQALPEEPKEWFPLPE